MSEERIEVLINMMDSHAERLNIWIELVASLITRINRLEYQLDELRGHDDN